MFSDGFNELMAGVENLTFDNAYNMTVNDIIVVALFFIVSFVFSALLCSIFKMLGSRREETADWVEVSQEPLMQEPERPYTPPEPELTPKQKLKKREAELQKREDAMKAERMRELARREKHVETRVTPDTGAATANQDPSSPDSFDEERRRVKRLLDDAEKRFASGEISERNFRTITGDYQKQLIDLDVKIKKKRETGM
ncbi:MAG: hypothetical protein ABIH11_06640 [Candidatus Altiarchaeota archaeon]